MATSIEGSEKEVRIDHIHANTDHLVKKIVKIGPVSPEIIWLHLNYKKKESSASKIFSPVEKFAGCAKN